MTNKYVRRGDQSEYNKMLEAFNGRNKTFQECVYHLIEQGFSYSQAKNAVHVYRKGGAPYSNITLARDIRDQLLNDFGAISKTHKQCVDHLMSQGYTYRQANTASYKYRQEKGLIRR